MDLLRKLFLGAALIILVVSCGDNTDKDELGSEILNIPSDLDDANDKGKMAQISFRDSVFYTGKITQGEILNYTYKFKNSGNAPLVISSVNGSCGCTVARDYPKGKILPGEEGEINVEFDSDNKWGEQTVTVNVVTNTVPSLTQLLIKTDIVVPDNMKTK